MKTLPVGFKTNEITTVYYILQLVNTSDNSLYFTNSKDLTLSDSTVVSGAHTDDGFLDTLGCSIDPIGFSHVADVRSVSVQFVNTDNYVDTLLAWGLNSAQAYVYVTQKDTGINLSTDAIQLFSGVVTNITYDRNNIDVSLVAFEFDRIKNFTLPNTVINKVRETAFSVWPDSMEQLRIPILYGNWLDGSAKTEQGGFVENWDGTHTNFLQFTNFIPMVLLRKTERAAGATYTYYMYLINDTAKSDNTLHLGSYDSSSNKFLFDTADFSIDHFFEKNGFDSAQLQGYTYCSVYTVGNIFTTRYNEMFYSTYSGEATLVNNAENFYNSIDDDLTTYTTIDQNTHNLYVAFFGGSPPNGDWTVISADIRLYLQFNTLATGSDTFSIVHTVNGLIGAAPSITATDMNNLYYSTPNMFTASVVYAQNFFENPGGNGTTYLTMKFPPTCESENLSVKIFSIDFIFYMTAGTLMESSISKSYEPLGFPAHGVTPDIASPDVKVMYSKPAAGNRMKLFPSMYETYRTKKKIRVRDIADTICVTCDGKPFPDWVDAGSRDNGYDEDDLITNPVYIIEDVLRTRVGITNINTSSFDALGDATTGTLKDAQGYVYIGDTIDAHTVINELCFEHDFFMRQDEAGDLELTQVATTGAVGTITQGMLSREAQVDVGITPSADRLTTSITLNYMHNEITGNYDDYIYLDADTFRNKRRGFNVTEAATYTAMVTAAAALTNGKENSATIDADYVRDFDTAHTLIKRVAGLLCRQRKEVTVSSAFFYALKYDVGDRVYLDLDLARGYFVVTAWKLDTTRDTVSLTLLEIV